MFASSPPRASSPTPPPSPPPTVRAVLRAHRQSYVDGAGAVVLFFVCTLLICGLQQLTASISDFPAPILAMVLVAAVMILAAQLVPGIDGVYGRYLRGPTDLLNRHMSIGFTVPFTMIMKEPMPSPRNVGLTIAGYLLTGLLNVVLAYAAAFGVQTLLRARPLLARTPPTGGNNARPVTASRPATDASGSSSSSSPANRLPPLALLPSLRLAGCRSRGSDVAPATPPQQQQHARTPEEKRDSIGVGGGDEAGDQRIRSCISDATTLAHSHPSGPGRGTATAGADSEPEPQPQPQPPPGEAAAAAVRGARAAACFAASHPVLCGSLAGAVLVGVPVAAATGRAAPLDVFVLSALWAGTLAVQAAVAGGGGGGRRWRPVLAALANAVLWSALGNMAYLAAAAAARHRTTAAALAAFTTGTTLADRMHAPPSAAAAAALGAGDLAVSLLDAGIVSWGLKLFECRAQLLSRAGAATLAVGAGLAAANLAGGPAALHAMGLTPASRALAFAARSVTLALAGPAMARLGGDVGLNAAMVVFNGIVFQVAMGLADARRRGGGGGGAAVQKEDVEAAAATPTPCTTPRRGSDSSTSTAASSGGATLAGSIDAAPPPPANAVPETHSSSSSAAVAPLPAKPADAVVVRLRGGGAAADDDDHRPPAGPPGLLSLSAFRWPARPANASSASSASGASGSSAATAAAGVDAPATVALGTTVGINAAAMGTAYLYENAGRAAPYAALSMTVFGVMTVVFASIQPLAAWVVAQAG